MKPGRITHAIALLLSSISSLFAHPAPSKTEPAKTKFNKKSDKLSEGLSLDPISFSPRNFLAPPEPGQRYPWKKSIVTTVFWIGEKPTANNPVPNRVSSWDKEWTKSYGGFDDPNPARRSNYSPVKFTPRQNPFYCALPYNDSNYRTPAGSPAGCPVVQGSVRRPSGFDLQRPLGRNPQR